MKQRIMKLGLLLAAVLMLTGCSMRTADEMYAFPKRSKDYNNLQSAIDGAMSGLEYCAPLSGEYQQPVQMADLDGDGRDEYLLFAKGTQGMPLRILIFRIEGGVCVHAGTIESNGSAFDLIEYVQMDRKPGLEIIVGKQVSDQILRSVSVYSYSAGQAEQLVSVNYTKFLTIDMDRDGCSELFVLRPGQTETDNGAAEVYRIRNDSVERSNEVDMSRPADQLKRIITGKLYSGEPAVYVASAVGNSAIITDVYAQVGDQLVNVTFSNESGTSIQTLRNYYVYADDIDNDGVPEIPELITMTPADGNYNADRQDLIRWYSMNADGGEIDKKYTYHNFVSGWYLELDDQWASRVSVRNLGYQYDFSIWDERFEVLDKVASVYVLTGENREEQAANGDWFVLHKTDSVIYAASISESAQNYGITGNNMIDRFHLIQQDWKTGET